MRGVSEISPKKVLTRAFISPPNNKTKIIVKKNNGWPFVWFDNGKLFIRENEKAKKLRVKHEGKLIQIFRQNEKKGVIITNYPLQKT